MIAGAPLSPDGLAVLAALLRLHPLRARLGAALSAALDATPSTRDPRAALALVLAKRRTVPLARWPDEAHRSLPPPSGRSPAARLLRRMERRQRTAQSDTIPLAPSPDLGERLLRVAAPTITPPFGTEPAQAALVADWARLWAEPDSGRRRDLVASRPPSVALRLGHAPRLSAEEAQRWLQRADAVPR